MGVDGLSRSDRSSSFNEKIDTEFDHDQTFALADDRLGDKAYDSDSFRKSLREDGITPVIPGRSNRKRIRYDKRADKGRNVIAIDQS
jgi:hypothetical protein